MYFKLLRILYTGDLPHPTNPNDRDVDDTQDHGLCSDRGNRVQSLIQMK